MVVMHNKDCGTENLIKVISSHTSNVLSAIEVQKIRHLSPTGEHGIHQGFYNPAAVRHNGQVVLLPRVEPNKGDGYSYIGKAVSNNDHFVFDPNFELSTRTVELPSEFYCPSERAQLLREQGKEPLPSLEDPRVTELNGTYHLLCTLFSKASMNAMIAHFSSPDLNEWKYEGVVSPTIPSDEAYKYTRDEGIAAETTKNTYQNRYIWIHNAAYVPRRPGDSYWLLLQVEPKDIAVPISDPNEPQDPEFWKKIFSEGTFPQYVVCGPELYGNASRVGWGAPPIVRENFMDSIGHVLFEQKPNRDYQATIIRHDNEDPRRIIAAPIKALFTATEEWEEDKPNGPAGGVLRVPFVCGALDDMIDGVRYYRLFYGAGDRHVGEARIRVDHIDALLEGQELDRRYSVLEPDYLAD